MINISVIIPAYNAEAFLAETVLSVLSQSYPPFEIIIVNDGSTDRTEDIALSFGERVRYIFQRNQGLSGARNTGIHAATGEWIALLDSDDLMASDKLRKQVAVIEQTPNLILVYSAFTYLYPGGATKEMQVFPARDLWPALRYRTPILPSTTVIRRSALLEVGGFRKLPTEDWDMWFRLIRSFSPSAFQSIDESLLLYRQWENNLSKRYMYMARGGLEMLDSLLLEDLSGIRRFIWRRKIAAKIFYNVSVAMREYRDPRYWSFAVESFLEWPFAGKVMPKGRYLVFANMMYKRLLGFQASLRYWWPRRDCRQQIADSA